MDTILVFIALPEEHDRFLDAFPAKETMTDSRHLYVEHKSDTNNIRLVSVLAAGMGIDNAYDATRDGITRFSPDIVVCVGIAESLTSDLRLGDISVSSEVIDISQNMKISETKPSKRSRT